jgi:hypothetical protein
MRRLFMNTQPPGGEAVDRYRANWQDEIDSAALYGAMATSESQPQLGKSTGDSLRQKRRTRSFGKTSSVPKVKRYRRVLPLLVVT